MGRVTIQLMALAWRVCRDRGFDLALRGSLEKGFPELFENQETHG